MGDHQVSSGLLDGRGTMGTLLQVTESVFVNSKQVMKSDIWRDYLERGSTWKAWAIGMPKVQCAGGEGRKYLKQRCAGEKRKNEVRGKAVRERNVDVRRGEADG